MRNLVLGAAGQLGTELVEELRRGGADVVAADREDCDVTSPGAVAQLFARTKPDIVYNAAAYTLIDQAESLREHAMKVNGLGAAIVAAHAREAGARLVHVSSDYVFGPGHSAPIDEARQPAPVNVYGRSKLWGEQQVARNLPGAVVLRPGPMYSRYGRNPLRRLVNVALSKKRTIAVIDDEVVAPTPALEVARTAIALGAQPVGGVFHASCHDSCTWYEFVRTFVDKMTLDVEVQGVSQERWGAPAPRPRYCVLDNLALRTLGLDHFQPWDAALEAYLSEYGEQIIWELA